MIRQKEKACPFDWDLLAHFMPFKGYQNIYIWMWRWQFYCQCITEHCEFLPSQWYILLNSDNLTPNSVSRSIFYSISDKKSQFFILCECIMFYHSLFVTPIGLQVFRDLKAGIFQYLKQCKQIVFSSKFYLKTCCCYWMRNSFLLNLDKNEVTLEDILKFITGCPTIPVIGFERKILVKFEHDCPDNCNCYPVASTCSLEITLPCHCKDYQAFHSDDDRSY